MVPADSLFCGEHGIHLWLAYYQGVPSTSHGALRALLSDAERVQEGRFHFADDRLRYLVTRAMVRTVLSRYAPVAPVAWGFDVNAWGRPETAARHGLPNLRFNISHARGLIALAVSHRRALGVDVEHMRARTGSVSVAAQIFSRSEAADLAALPPHQRQRRFYEYWTLKEAYIKARGMGLSLPLDGFSFHFPHAAGVTIAFDASFDDQQPQRWCFWQSEPGLDYLLALCAEHSGGIMPTTTVRTVRTVVPLAGTAARDAAWCRISGTRRPSAGTGSEAPDDGVVIVDPTVKTVFS